MWQAHMPHGKLVLRTAHYLARWARGSVAFQAPRQRVELGRDVCRRVLVEDVRCGVLGLRKW
jgi:hypothetical protein